MSAESGRGKATSFCAKRRSVSPDTSDDERRDVSVPASREKKATSEVESHFEETPQLIPVPQQQLQQYAAWMTKRYPDLLEDEVSANVEQNPQVNKVFCYFSLQHWPNDFLARKELNVR